MAKGVLYRYTFVVGFFWYNQSIKFNESTLSIFLDHRIWGGSNIHWEDLDGNDNLININPRILI